MKIGEAPIHAFKVAHDAYEVEVTWGEEDVSARIWKPGSRRPYYGKSRLNISVSQPETEPYPEGTDERYSCIQPRLEAYAGVAAIVTNRLIRYSKFRLAIPSCERPVQTIFWLQTLNGQMRTALPHHGLSLSYALKAPLDYVMIPPCDYPAFGIKAFTPAQSDDLEKALQADSSYEL